MRNKKKHELLSMIRSEIKYGELNEAVRSAVPDVVPDTLGDLAELPGITAGALNELADKKTIRVIRCRRSGRCYVIKRTDNSCVVYALDHERFDVFRSDPAKQVGFTKLVRSTLFEEEYEYEAPKESQPKE